MGYKVDLTNVFVKFLPSNVGDSELAEIFSPFGKIVSVKVIVDPHSGTSRGYGYS